MSDSFNQVLIKLLSEGTVAASPLFDAFVKQRLLESSNKIERKGWSGWSLHDEYVDSVWDSVVKQLHPLFANHTLSDHGAELACLKVFSESKQVFVNKLDIRSPRELLNLYESAIMGRFKSVSDIFNDLQKFVKMYKLDHSKIEDFVGIIEQMYDDNGKKMVEVDESFQDFYNLPWPVTFIGRGPYSSEFGLFVATDHSGYSLFKQIDESVINESVTTESAKYKRCGWTGDGSWDSVIDKYWSRISDVAHFVIANNAYLAGEKIMATSASYDFIKHGLQNSRTLGSALFRSVMGRFKGEGEIYMDLEATHDVDFINDFWAICKQMYNDNGKKAVALDDSFSDFYNLPWYAQYITVALNGDFAITTLTDHNGMSVARPIANE